MIQMFFIVLPILLVLGLLFIFVPLQGITKPSTESGNLPHHTVLKSQRRVEEFKSWDNEYLSLLEKSFLSTYGIPYDKAQLAYVYYTNFTKAKKAIDVIGDRAYWFDDCINTLSLYPNKKNRTKTMSGGGVIDGFFGSSTKHELTKINNRYTADMIVSRTITADMITTGTICSPTCTCESCDFNAKMNSYNHYKKIWDHYKLEISREYPDFQLENLKDFSQLEIGKP